MRKEIIAVVIAFAFVGIGKADIVELDLFTLGCPSTYDYDSPSWTSDFDLGVTFLEISHVYIDWAGEITGGLAEDDSNPDPFPIDVGLLAYLGTPLNWRHTSVWGGEGSYPDAEPFYLQSEFVYGSMPWSELFDGQASISIEYDKVIIEGGGYLEHGSVDLTSATLVVDGLIVPEPATLLLLALGSLISRESLHKSGNYSIIESR
jgi:hypothetical protein